MENTGGSRGTAVSTSVSGSQSHSDGGVGGTSMSNQNSNTNTNSGSNPNYESYQIVDSVNVLHEFVSSQSFNMSAYLGGIVEGMLRTAGFERAVVTAYHHDAGGSGSGSGVGGGVRQGLILLVEKM